jgi:hypothetical protein
MTARITPSKREATLDAALSEVVSMLMKGHGTFKG